MAKLKKLRSPKQSKIRSLILGLILLASSVGVVTITIAENNHTDEYLVAARDLPAGSPVSITDMKVAMVNLGLGADQYLRKDELPGGSYVLGPLRAGHTSTREQGGELGDSDAKHLFGEHMINAIL
jgi:flagella basal body P-ring formation protein FlgA